VFKVYWNLHKKCFSIKEGNLPVRHETLFLLCNCRFAVSKKGRDRCIAEKRRNVHARIIAEKFIDGSHDWKEITDRYPIGHVKYNPYRSEYFTMDGEPILTAKYLLCRAVKETYQVLAYD
jgi:hypothetical protein